MRLKGYRLLIVFLATLACAKIFAQADSAVLQSLGEKISVYSASKATSALFVHFDKNVYTNNENVWFTGYVLNSTNNVDLHNTLSVALVRNDDRSILAEEKFLMSKGLSFGNIFLPDSLPPGNYSFIAYTNVMTGENDKDIFIQPVTIKTVKEPSFIATLKLADSINANSDSVRVVLRAYTKDITLVRNADVEFYLGDSLRPLISGRLKTDNFGEAKIKVPVKQITAQNNILRTQIKHGKETRSLNLRLPVYKNEPVIKFYPEGGNLVNGVASTVGWEAVDQEGEPLMIAAVLFKNQQPFDTIQTDNYGLGKFTFTPEKGADYSVKLVNVSTGSSYKLPIALEKGPVLTIKNPLAVDTLVVQLSNSESNSKWLLLIHNYRETFIATSISANGMRTIKVPLVDIPKGLATFTLLDQTGKPWAERVFFAHFNKRTVADISTQKPEFKTREKVQLKLKLRSTGAGNGVTSIAVVQDNRIELRKFTDIESYTYLKHNLTSIPFKTKLFGSEQRDKDFLEKVLLIRGWRRYTWVDMMSAKSGDTIHRASATSFLGSVTFNGKAVNKPVDLGLFTQKSLSIIQTDSTGKFIVPFERLVLEPETELKLFVSNKKQDQYSITLFDPYTGINKKLSKTLSFQNFESRATEQNSQVVVINSNERANKLLDVKVTTRKDNSVYATGVNECGDWVCQYNILNCHNHPVGRPPIVGRQYFQNGQPIIYEGCGKGRDARHYIISAKGIYTNKEFYASDYSKFNPPDPEYLSTLYWNHSILTNIKGEAEISFYTGDIPGRFKVIVQGFTSDDVFYGEHSFAVKKE